MLRYVTEEIIKRKVDIMYIIIAADSATVRNWKKSAVAGFEPKHFFSRLLVLGPTLTCSYPIALRRHEERERHVGINPSPTRPTQNNCTNRLTCVDRSKVGLARFNSATSNNISFVNATLICCLNLNFICSFNHETYVINVFCQGITEISAICRSRKGRHYAVYFPDSDPMKCDDIKRV